MLLSSTRQNLLCRVPRSAKQSTRRLASLPSAERSAISVGALFIECQLVALGTEADIGTLELSFGECRTLDN